MTGDGRKLDPPFGLDMDFGEALERFVGTKPGEVVESVERAKTKKPPESEAPRRPARRQRGGGLEPDRKRKPGSSGG